jgi:hypothetical protein
MSRTRSASDFLSQALHRDASPHARENSRLISPLLLLQTKHQYADRENVDGILADLDEQNETAPQEIGFLDFT